MNEAEINEFVTECNPLPSLGRVREALADFVKPGRRKEKPAMADKSKRLRDPVILAAFAAMFTARLSIGGAGLPPAGGKLEGRPVSTLWHVTYRGGPNTPRQDTRVDLRVSETTISYSAADGRPGSEFSIPVADVSDVSDAIIQGTRDDKVFGPGEPDFISPCAEHPDPKPAKNWFGALMRRQNSAPAFSGQNAPGNSSSGYDTGLILGCSIGGAALELPFAIVDEILMSIPYTDRFIRVDWQREGEHSAAVFQVRARDFTPLREELERVTEKSLGNRVPEQTSHVAIHVARTTRKEVLDPEVARIRVQRWLSDRCQSSSLDKPSWLRPSPNLKTLSLCPPATAEMDEAQDQLLAK